MKGKVMSRRCLISTVLLLIGLAEAADFELTIDVDYVPNAVYDDNRDRLDIYMPADADKVPVVVFFHGGTLHFGSKDDASKVASRVVAGGVGVVSANHRLSPGVMHPAHAEDAAAATAWVIENIEQYGGDPEQVFVSGHSSGGYLAALLALDEKYLAAHGYDRLRLRGAIPVSPFLYVEETAAERPKDTWGEDPDDWLAASVTPHIHAGQPPMLLIYADGDAEWRREQNDRFTAAMHEAGNKDVQVVEVANRNHRTLMSEADAKDDRVGASILEFVKTH